MKATEILIEQEKLSLTASKSMIETLIFGLFTSIGLLKLITLTEEMKTRQKKSLKKQEVKLAPILERLKFGRSMLNLS